MVRLEPGQLYWDEGAKHFLLLVDRAPMDEHYWLLVVYYPTNGQFQTVKYADPREAIELHCKRVY